MENEEAKLISELKEKIFQIFSDFMTRVTKFEELAAVGSRLLVGFQQGLEFLRRPPIDKTSELVDCIIKANKTKRVLSYVEAGCVNTHDSVQNINKLHTCQLGLWKNLRQAKCVVNELECLLEDARGIIQSASASASLPHFWCNDIGHELVLPATTIDKEEMVSPDIKKPEVTDYAAILVSPDLQKPEVTDYAAMMAILYSMVKQDYMMQERIVSSLNLKSSSGELESYCLMSSLRPFVDDEIMRHAWRLLP